MGIDNRGDGISGSRKGIASTMGPMHSQHFELLPSSRHVARNPPKEMCVAVSQPVRRTMLLPVTEVGPSHRVLHKPALKSRARWVVPDDWRRFLRHFRKSVGPGTHQPLSGLLAVPLTAPREAPPACGVWRCQRSAGVPTVDRRITIAGALRQQHGFDSPTDSIWFPIDGFCKAA